MTELRGQLSTLTTALSMAHTQIADYQQQLTRAKQPPAVVVSGGPGVVVNQDKMNRIAESLQLGRKIQAAAPRKNAEATSLQPWIEQTNKWYRATLALIRKKCTPQAVAIVENQSGRATFTYFAIHSDQAVQATFGGLDRVLGNITTLLGRSELCP